MGSGGGWRCSPRKAAALAAASKQLDGRWVAEQRDLRPELGQLWTPPAERLWRQQERAGAAGGRAVVPPLPSAQQLAAHFLGLCL